MWFVCVLRRLFFEWFLREWMRSRECTFVHTCRNYFIRPITCNYLLMWPMVISLIVSRWQQKWFAMATTKTEKKHKDFSRTDFHSRQSTECHGDNVVTYPSERWMIQARLDTLENSVWRSCVKTRRRHRKWNAFGVKFSVLIRPHYMFAHDDNNEPSIDERNRRKKNMANSRRAIRSTRDNISLRRTNNKAEIQNEMWFLLFVVESTQNATTFRLTWKRHKRNNKIEMDEMPVKCNRSLVAVKTRNFQFWFFRLINNRKKKWISPRLASEYVIVLICFDSTATRIISLFRFDTKRNET